MPVSFARLHASIERHLAETVTYSPSGGSDVSVAAAVGECRREYAQADGVAVQTGTATAYIRAALLAATPKRGDRLTTAAGVAYDIIGEPTMQPDGVWEMDVREIRS